MLFDIDPGLPSFGTSDPGSSPGIQLDATNRVRKIVLANTARTNVLRNDTWNSIVYVASGINSKPYFQCTPPQAYDGLNFSPSDGEPLISTLNQPYCIWFVMRTRLNSGGTELMKLYNADGSVHINLYPDPSTGSYTIGQNNSGLAIATESGAPALNQWDIMAVTCDGDKGRLFRNGVKVAETNSYTNWGGFGIGGCQAFEFMNSVAVDVARIIVCGNCPSNAQMNSEATRMLTLYPSIVTQTTVTGGISSPTTFPPYSPDLSTDYIKTPIYPSAATPTSNTVAIGHGLSLGAGAVNVAHLVFGTVTGANVANYDDLWKYCYSNPFVGNQLSAIGSPMDDPNAGSTYSRTRTHPKNSPFQLLKFGSFGIGLQAWGGGPNKDQLGNGQIQCAMFRLQPAFVPGSVIKIRMKFPPGIYSWAVPWLFTGQQISPGPGGNPYTGGGTPGAYIIGSDTSGEYDINDGFMRTAIPMGRQMNSSYVLSNQTNRSYGTSPSNLYRANSNGFVSHPSAGPPFVSLDGTGTVTSFSSGFADFIFNWRGDGSNKQDYFIGPADDAQPALVYSSDYCEYLADSFTDNTHTFQIGMHLMCVANVGPTFNDLSGMTQSNEGITDGWTYFIQSIDAWIGGAGIVNPDSHRAD